MARTTDPYAAINLRATPQSEPADERQVPNSAGGYTFTLDDEARIRRFLILGSDGATYYTSAAELTKDNAKVILAKAREDARGLTDILLEISLAGRAPKQNPTLFALAAACSLGDDAGRAYALAALPRIARTGTHLFIFARYVEQFRGWGRGLRKAVGRWYIDEPVGSLAYQAVKYRQREGWSHRDLLRLAHPETIEPERKALFDWISGRGADHLHIPALVNSFEVAQNTTETGRWVSEVRMRGLSWEMLPDAALAEPKVWEALIDQGMPMTALIRQLPRLTRLGVAHSHRAAIVKQLTDREHLAKARIHPVNVLVALRTYSSGKSARGESTWTPERAIVDALDAAFYASFGFVEPTGKRTLLALDVSGSMTSAISNMPLSAREASAAMALVTAATEPDYDIVGFTNSRNDYQPTWGNYRQNTGLTPLAISPRQRLDDAIAAVSNLPFGGTDCALPMLWALEKGERYETIVVYTDSETWAGTTHPHQALERYRRETGIPAKLIVVGMTATNFTIADPSDAGSLDVVGFDSAVPQLISDFSRGL